MPQDIGLAPRGISPDEDLKCCGKSDTGENSAPAGLELTGMNLLAIGAAVLVSRGLWWYSCIYSPFVQHAGRRILYNKYNIIYHFIDKKQKKNPA